MRLYRMHHIIRVAQLAQQISAHLTMFLNTGMAFIINIMQQASNAPLLLILAKLPRISPHRRFNRQSMLYQTFILIPLGKKAKRLITTQSH
jgi:hypothetical protein